MEGHSPALLSGSWRSWGECMGTHGGNCRGSLEGQVRTVPPGKWEREGGRLLYTSRSHVSGTWKNNREEETGTCEQDLEPAQDGTVGVLGITGLSVWGCAGVSGWSWQQGPDKPGGGVALSLRLPGPSWRSLTPFGSQRLVPLRVKRLGITGHGPSPPLAPTPLPPSTPL